MLRWPVLLALSALAAHAVVLSDAETTDRWKGVSLLPDAKVGAHAVRYPVPTEGVGSAYLDLAPLKVAFDPTQQLSFWYRLNGQGEASLMIKVVAFPFADGYQATWPIRERAVADGQWHQATVDLGTPYMKWGDRPDQRSQSLIFRVQQLKGGPLTIDLDDVTLTTPRFTAKVTSHKVTGQQAQLTLALHNGTAQPLKLRVGALGTAQTVTVPAGGDATPTLTGPLGDGPGQPLEALPCRVTVAVDGEPASAKEVTVDLVRPLPLPPRPRLLVSAAELPALKDRIARLPWAKAIADGELKRANDLLTKPISIPDRGSQWWHWYACKKDGARLKTISPTEHKCPVCGTVYTGYPYDDVVLSGVHDGWARGLRSLGLAWQLTGDARYAARGREILLAYADKYLQLPLHDVNGKPSVGGGHVGPQTLDESTWLIPFAQGADLIWDTLSPADRQRAETGVLRPAAACIRQHRMGIHNIQCWKNSAVGLVGLLLDDPELIADAITSDHGFRQQIAQGVSADGQWYEGAWGYHFYATSAMLPLVEAATRCGVNLFDYTADGRSYRRLFDAPLDLATPNLTLPPFNDSERVDVKGQGALYEVALARYHDPRYAEVIGTQRRGLDALIEGVETLPAPPAEGLGSRNFPSTGYAVLEDGAGDAATWACLKYGPHGGGHGHPDKLNLVLYRQGTLFGLDPGTTAYGVPLQKEWFRSTLAHNTLTVDEANQAEATGRCLAFGSQPGLSGALADAGAIYPGVSYRRAVALLGPSLVLVLDLAKADKDHTFDFAWHNTGAWAAAPQGPAVTMPDKLGYKHLRDVVQVAGELPAVRVSDQLTVALAVTSASGETWAGTGVGHNTAERVPCVVRRVHGREAVVGWALDLDGQAPAVKVIPVDGGATVEATVAGKTWRLTATPDAAVKLLVDGDGKRLEAKG